MVPEMSVSHGLSSGPENVHSNIAHGKSSVRVPHCAAATRHPGVLCLSAEVRATSPTLLNKMPHSPVHRKSKVQSDNLMSYPPISSHWVDYVPAPVWNWDSPSTRTPHFCRALCDRWHIHHWKEPLSRIRHLRMCPAEYGMIHSCDPCRHPTVHTRKSGDTASHSNLSSCGLALLTVAHQALMIVSVSTSSGNIQWKRQPLHVSKRVVFLPLRSLSLTLPRTNARFSQSSSVTLHGGALLNCFRKAAITCDMVCPLCCLPCTHTLATKRSSIE